MKVLVINPNYQDATSYYRAWGTFKDLTDRFNIEFSLYESTFVLQPPNKEGKRNWGAAWPDLIKFDVVFFQRALGENSLQLLRYCKDLGLKVWYDMDDDLWNIPDSYKIKDSFPPAIMKTIEEHIKESDLITCSTQELANVINEKTNKTAWIVPNAWDVDRFNLQPHNPEGQTIWRGTSTHIDDIRKCSDQIKSISKQTKINFFGYNPIKDRPFLVIHSHDYTPPLDPIIYFRTIQKSRPKAILVPLIDSQFNRSKSNIAWLEATANGALTYSNKVGEFAKVGLTFEQYGTLTESQVIDYVKENQQVLMDSFSLKEVNNLRAQLLIGLINNYNSVHNSSQAKG